jgi:hypothetical protein
MICKIQVVTLGEDGREETREIARLERTDLKPETLGLTLAELLPDRTLPELLFLETKWASLMSYGMTSELLQEVLPIDEPVNAFTLRQHVAEVAERLERKLGDEQFCFIEGCQASWDQLPAPDGPLTVGIDGGYVRGWHKQGSFEVIAGKSLLAFKREQEGDGQRQLCLPSALTHEFCYPCGVVAS